MALADQIVISGWSNMREENLELIREITPSRAIGRGIKSATITAHRIAVAVTHIDTSALKHSHRINFQSGSISAEGVVFVSDIANPESGTSTAVYGPIEDARGGDHAFYSLVVTDHIQEVLNSFHAMFGRGLF